VYSYVKDVDNREYIHEYDDKIIKILKNFKDILKNGHASKTVNSFSDLTAENLFNFFFTSGKGAQEGSPGKECHRITISEYKEPFFNTV
tara:strand:+ start:4248 stop:4514 length:267 start_codon:yes stop_codon:yes gene_type:complete